ncbi:MAG: hypothetical protein GX878_11310, partial [Firmicutes bacterium]|nr:hypothetical protein [Bacillota bacterium]
LSTAIRGDDYACPKEIKEMILKNKSKRIVNGYSGKSGDCRLLPIIVRNERIGYFYSKRSPGELSYIQRCHIDHATTAAALKMLKQKTNEMTENRVKMQLVNEVIFSKAGAMESVRALAGSYGWDINMDAAAVIFKKAGIEKAKGERQNEALYHYVDQYIAGREGLFAVNLNNNVLMFIACDDHSKPKMLDEIKLICGYLNENMPEFHQYKVGIGQICSGYHNYDTSYYQAMDAIAIGQVVLPGNAIYDIDDLIMYRILWNYDNATELEKFVENTIGRLINKDDESLKLINTLEKYLENKSVRQTAEQLYIHNNTAVYRLNKIKNILGTDLEEPEACLNLITAIKIYKYLQAPGREKGN